jgi:hypothetical protein
VGGWGFWTIGQAIRPLRIAWGYALTRLKPPQNLTGLNINSLFRLKPKQPFAMLCGICQTIAPELLHSKQLFPLHSRWRDVISSAKAGCCICGWISNDERISKLNTDLDESGIWALGSASYTFSGVNSRTALSIGSFACIGGHSLRLPNIPCT